MKASIFGRTRGEKGEMSKNPTTMRKTLSSQEGSEEFPAAVGRKPADGEEITQLCRGGKKNHGNQGNGRM